MMDHRRRASCSRSLVAIATWVSLPSLLILSIAACAASNETEEVGLDASTVLAPSDSGAEGSILDGGAEAETSVVPCAVGNLCSVPIPIPIGYVVAMAGRSKNDVWASASRGDLMHWNGQQWTRHESGGLDTFSSLFLSPDELWGISGNLVMRRGFDASSVRTFRLRDPLRGLTGVAVLPSGEPYVSFGNAWNTTVGRDNLAKITDFDTRALEVVPDPVDPVTNRALAMAVRALCYVPDTALWAVGDRGVVARYPVSPVGGGVVVPLDSRADLFTAWGDDDHLWAGGSDGTIVHFDGAAWHQEKTGTSETINAIFGFSSTDIWAAGDNGTILHFDGSTWSHISLPGYGGHLRAIWGAAPDDVWIGGEFAMFHWGALP